MKRVLVTGFTSIGSKDRPVEKRKIATTVYAVVDLLREQGVEVEQRPITPGEDLSAFDRIIVVPSTLGGFASGYVLGSGWAVAHWASKVTLLLDDWQCAKIQPSILGFLKNADKNWKKHQLFDRVEEWEKYREQVELGLKGILYLYLPMMAPTFGGKGSLKDLGIELTDRPTLLFDPSIHFSEMYGEIYTPRVPHTEVSAKYRRWISTSLTDRSRWALKEFDGEEWEVYTYGCKARGQLRLTERELVTSKYADAWGVLSPPTGLASGCWWRARYQHAIEAGCVLAGNPHETVFCGEAYGYSPGQIETFDDSQLEWLRDSQKKAYLKLRWDKPRLISALNTFLFTPAAN